MFVSMSSADIEDVIICSADTGSHYIPSSVCKYYLHNFRANKDDVSYLQSRSGLNFIVNMPEKTDKKDLINYFLSKGLDINKPSKIDGLTPIHAAILLNNPDIVKLLIKHGASLTTLDERLKLTPLQFANDLASKNPAIDRSAVIALLKG